MKVSKLSGALLDKWVARAEGKEVYIHGDSCFLKASSRDWHLNPNGDYSPSTDWAQGGPIIVREGITIAFHEWYLDGPKKPATGTYWRTYLWRPAWKDPIRFEGSDPLVIAMQTHVASKFGEEVGEL